MTRALVSVILVFNNEFIKNDNQNITNVKFYLSDKTEKVTLLLQSILQSV